MSERCKGGAHADSYLPGQEGARTMFGLGMPELLIILVIVLIFFGGKRLPVIGKGLGQSLREFREVTQEASHSEVIDVEKVEESKEETPPAAAAEEVSEQPASSPTESIHEEIGRMPGVQEAKEIKDTAKKIKKVTSFLTKKKGFPF